MGGQSRAVVEPGSGTSRDGATLIVDAGIELMSERGYHATSIRSIAKRAGMSTANLYHHFDSKQALLVQIMFGGIVRLRHDTDRARAEAGGSAVDQLDAVVREHVVAHARRREVSFLTTSELRSLPKRERNRISRLFDEQQRCFDEVVELGIEQGRFVHAVPARRGPRAGQHVHRGGRLVRSRRAAQPRGRGRALRRLRPLAGQRARLVGGSNAAAAASWARSGADLHSLLSSAARNGRCSEEVSGLWVCN